MAKVTVDSLISAFANETVTEALCKAIQSFLQSVINETVESRMRLIDDKLDRLQKDIKGRDDIIVGLQKENGDLKQLLNKQAQQVDQLETYSKQDNLIIHGLPCLYSELATGSVQAEENSHISENAKVEVIFLNFCASKLGVEVRSEDISACHHHHLPKRVNATNAHPPMIVRFTSRKILFQVLSGRKKLRESHERIFINKHLIKSTCTIFSAARKLAKEKKVLQAWTNTGYVVVKLLNDRLKTISSLSHLDSL